MSYAIVYSSRTGNTAMLAKAIEQVLPAGGCLYTGAPNAKALAADTIYVGFWTDKGSCDESIAQFLKELTGQKVFLFGTAGFGGESRYFAQILDRVQQNLGSGVSVIGTYMCQGKMPQAVRDRYLTMVDSPKRTEFLQNFDRALQHPDGQDLAALQSLVTG